MKTRARSWARLAGAPGIDRAARPAREREVTPRQHLRDGLFSRPWLAYLARVGFQAIVPDGPGLIEAAGGIVWRDLPEGPRLAVVRRSRQRDWRLPKGKLAPGEDFESAAVREVAEETGWEAHLVEFAGYTLSRGKHGATKLTLFWHMEASRGGDLAPNEEIARVEWLSWNEALRRIEHPEERRLLNGARAPRRLRSLAAGRLRVT